MDNQPQQPVSQPENNPQPIQNPVTIQPNVVESYTQSNGDPHMPYQMTNPIAEPAPGIAPKHKSKKPLMLLCLILILALIGGGAYALVGQKTSYQSVVTKFITAVQTKNKTAAISLESPAFQAELKSTVGATNFEIYCSSLGQFCTAYFSNSFINKSVVTYKSYTSSSGIRGKEVVYTAKYASEGSKGGNLNCSNEGSTGTLTIAAIPKGNSWLIDYVNASASSSTITCNPSGSTSTSTSTKTSTTTPVASSPYAGWNTYTLPKEKLLSVIR